MRRPIEASCFFLVVGLLFPWSMMPTAAGSQSAAFAELFEEYRRADADKAVAEFARWSWQRVDAEAAIKAPDWRTSATLALFHIEAGLAVGSSFRAIYLRPGIQTLSGRLQELEPHYRLALGLITGVAQQIDREAKGTALRLSLAAEAVRARNYPGLLSMDWVGPRWFPDEPLIYLTRAATEEWWVQPLVREGDYQFLGGMVDPCQTVSIVEGRAPAGPARDAEIALRKAIALDPDLVEAQLRLGRLLSLTRRQREAQQVLERATQQAVATNSTWSRYLAATFLGESYEFTNDPDAALRWYGSAVLARPDAPTARVAAAQLLLRRGDSALAWALVRELGVSRESRGGRPDPWMEYGHGTFRHAREWVRELRRDLGLRDTPALSSQEPPLRQTAVWEQKVPPQQSVGDDPLSQLAGRTKVFRSRVDAVRMDVRVVHRNEPVSGLSATNFEVFDKGVRQRFDLIQSPQRLAVALVLDLSHSSQPRALAELVQAANTLLEALEPEDEVSLVTFGDKITVAQAPTRNHAEIRRALASARTNWAARSQTLDAIVVGTALVVNASGYPVVILLGDGGDNASFVTGPRAQDVRRGAGATVDIVASNPDYVHDIDVSYGRVPQPRISTEDGGSVFRTAQVDLAAALRRRMSFLRQHYVLSFVPTGVVRDGWHKVAIRLRGTAGAVHGRPGYFGGVPQ